MEQSEILDNFNEASAGTELDFHDGVPQIPSEPSSLPNSCTPSPPGSNDMSHLLSRNVNESNSISPFFNPGKLRNLKRGPGRPRKDCIDGESIQKTLKALNKKTGDQLSVEEKMSQMVDDMPYFNEKWPSKVCALCNLDERSQLGQGEMLRLEVADDFNEKTVEVIIKDESSNAGENSSDLTNALVNKRQKGLNRSKSEYMDELEKIGHWEPIDFDKLLDTKYFYVHRLCAMWSFGIQIQENGSFEKTAAVVVQSLKRKCSHCNHYGASVICKMSCPNFFHLPCAAASGAFQIIQTYTTFCKEHVQQVPNICKDSEANILCRHCSDLGDVSNLIMCTVCGDHYHGLCIGVKNSPGVRAGWQCKTCRKCQICRIPDNTEERLLTCEQCHKIYHAHCLRPIISSIPKYGWKCRPCRVCSDCGSRTPGSGTSSRWHSHYTICDSCYQQRNKGFSCPICHRAYRAASYKEMVKCSRCNKFVHSTCDQEADLPTYHSRKETNPDYDYICPPCKNSPQSSSLVSLAANRKYKVFDDESSSGALECNYPTSSEDAFDKTGEFAHGKGKPFKSIKFVKKRFGASSVTDINRGKGKFLLKKKPRFSEMNRKRGQKSKLRSMYDAANGGGLNRPGYENSKGGGQKAEDDPSLENKLVLCSAKDRYILTQDICIMCGALGNDKESCLIACTQCGQCYHPYCVNVRITTVILEKGWRCLDCTVCEGCGQKNDEARLILCDECDISFHIYCTDPPLEYVPQGNWKCKWCASCQKCGRNNPGENSTWKNSYSECGPCASVLACAVCSVLYVDEELVIQCLKCQRWLHGKCDSIHSMEEAEKYNGLEYVCLYCRPKNTPPAHLVPIKKAITNENGGIQAMDIKPSESMQSQSLDVVHNMDGAFLTDKGLDMLKSLQTEMKKRRKPKLGLDLNAAAKNSGFLSVIDAVASGTPTDNNFDDFKIEDSKEEAEIYKDGMVWTRSDMSPPQGFTVTTNDQGVSLLRKKRQRNLQKLGVGGFSVRNRATRKDLGLKEDAEIGDNGEILPVLTTETVDKRKKPKKKILKGKLAESYPEYLQEAFFGKCLLDVENKSHNFESDSTDDDRKSNIFHDESFGFESKDSSGQQTQSKLEKQLTTSQKPKKPEETFNSNLNQSKQVNLVQQNSIIKVEDPAEQFTKSNDGSSFYDPNFNRTGTPASLTPNHNPSLTPNHNPNYNPMNTVTPPTPSPAANIIRTDPNLNSTLNPALNPTQSNLNELTDNRFQESPLPISQNSNKNLYNPGYNVAAGNDNGQRNVVDSFKNILNNKFYNYDIVKTAGSGIKDKNDCGPVKIENLNVLNTGQNFHPAGIVEYNPGKQQNELNQVQPKPALMPVPTGDVRLYANPNVVEQPKYAMNPEQQPFVQNPDYNKPAQMMMNDANNFNMYNIDPEQQQNQLYKQQMPQMKTEVGMSVDNVMEQAETAGPSDIKSVEKSTERMRRDEDLGKMATISAVLYANTCFPDLIKEYPQWKDRCKQIYKRWRGLSNEKKAPFLQQAKDNRSALRMQKMQQTQADNMQQKLMKEKQLPYKDQSKSSSYSLDNTTDLQSFDLLTPTNQENKSFMDDQSKQNQMLSSVGMNVGVGVGVSGLMQQPKSSPTKSWGVPGPSPSGMPFDLPNDDNGRNNIKGVTDVTENAGIGEVGDILGGLADDDEYELLKSITAEIGDEFNILEYADPEIESEADANNQNLLDKLTLGPSDNSMKSMALPNDGFAPNQANQTLRNRLEQTLNKGDSGLNMDTDEMKKQNFTDYTKFKNNLSIQPPPPYPGQPPPPYPVTSTSYGPQETGLLLDELVEEEKREQYNTQQAGLSLAHQMERSDVKNMNWNKKPHEHFQTVSPGMKEANQPPILFNANLTPAPPMPPEHILSESDKKMLENYEHWLRSTNEMLKNQLKYYEDNIFKLRKARKTLNSKQRLIKKTGGEMSQEVAMEHAAVSSNQAVVQKHLEYARRQCKQHELLIQDFQRKYVKPPPPQQQIQQNPQPHQHLQIHQQQNIQHQHIQQHPQQQNQTIFMDSEQANQKSFIITSNNIYQMNDTSNIFSQLENDVNLPLGGNFLESSLSGPGCISAIDSDNSTTKPNQMVADPTNQSMQMTFSHHEKLPNDIT